MTLALARSLLLADAVPPTALAEALFLSATRGASLVRTLLTARAIDTLRLEQMLERGEAPYMRHIAPVAALVDRLPPGLCDRLLALPVRHDPRTGTVDVAVVDGRDPHPAEEIAFWLKAPVRMVRTSIASMESALVRLGRQETRAESEPEPEPGMRSLAPPIWAPPPPIPPHLLRTPMYGTPAAQRRPKSEPPPDEHELTIPLTRRNLGMPPVAQVRIEPAADMANFAAPVDVGPPAVERKTRRGDTDPILDLRRRKAAPSLPARPPRLESGGSVQVDPQYSPASTVRGPFAPIGSTAVSPPAHAAPPEETFVAEAKADAFAAGIDAEAIVNRIRGARDRDEILDLLVDGARTIARRAAVLAVRRDALVGWTGSRELADRSAFRAVRLPNSMPTIFHESLEREGALISRIPMDAAHAPLVAVIKPPLASKGHDVVVAAVQADGRPAAVVFVDGIGEPAIAVERLGVLARTAGEALGRVLRDRRK